MTTEQTFRWKPFKNVEWKAQLPLNVFFLPVGLIFSFLASSPLRPDLDLNCFLVVFSFEILLLMISRENILSSNSIFFFLFFCPEWNASFQHRPWSKLAIQPWIEWFGCTLAPYPTPFDETPWKHSPMSPLAAAEPICETCWTWSWKSDVSYLWQFFQAFPLAEIIFLRC